jgi:hypothetical protein
LPRKAAVAGTRRRSTAQCSFQAAGRCGVGEIATVKIERADAYDLHGMAVGF